MTVPDAQRSLDLQVIYDEYQRLLVNTGVTPGQELSEASQRALIAALVGDAEWSSEAASELVDVVNQYGHFFLRNAAALAIALNIEDGVRGY